MCNLSNNYLFIYCIYVVINKIIDLIHPRKYWALEKKSNIALTGFSLPKIVYFLFTKKQMRLLDQISHVIMKDKFVYL